MYEAFNPIKALPDKALRGYSKFNIVNFLHSQNCFLLDYRHNGNLAVNIINSMCEEYDICPQLLLVTLQREQSLISMTSESQVKKYTRPDGRIVN